MINGSERLRVIDHLCPVAVSQLLSVLHMVGLVIHQDQAVFFRKEGIDDPLDHDRLSGRKVLTQPAGRQSQYEGLLPMQPACPGGPSHTSSQISLQEAQEGTGPEYLPVFRRDLSLFLQFFDPLHDLPGRHTVGITEAVIIHQLHDPVDSCTIGGAGEPGLFAGIPAAAFCRLRCCL